MELHKNTWLKAIYIINPMAAPWDKKAYQISALKGQHKKMSENDYEIREEE